MSGLSRTPGKRVWANPHRGFESRPLRQLAIQIKALGPFFVSIYQSSYQFRAGLESTHPDSVGRSQAAHCSTSLHSSPSACTLPGHRPSRELTPEQADGSSEHCTKQRDEGTSSHARKRPSCQLCIMTLAALAGGIDSA